MLPRVVAVAVALGFVFAEWASLHHLDAAACADSRGAADHADAADDTWAREAGDSARLFDSNTLALGELAGDICHLCRSSRERLASPPATWGEPSERPRSFATFAAHSHDGLAFAATHIVAPKTSPPA